MFDLKHRLPNVTLRHVGDAAMTDCLYGVQRSLSFFRAMNARGSEFDRIDAEVFGQTLREIADDLMVWSGILTGQQIVNQREAEERLNAHRSRHFDRNL